MKESIFSHNVSSRTHFLVSNHEADLTIYLNKHIFVAFVASILILCSKRLCLVSFKFDICCKKLQSTQAQWRMYTRYTPMTYEVLNAR